MVDQIGLEEPSNSARAATDPHVEVAGQSASLLERRDGVGVDEMKGCSALHLEHRSRMVGQDDDWGVEDRGVAPPSLPFLVCPWAALRSELVAPHDFHADPGPPRAGERVVDAEGSLRLSVDSHLAKGARLDRPFHEPRACVTEGSVELLSLADGTRTVCRWFPRRVRSCCRRGLEGLPTSWCRRSHLCP